MPDHLLRELNPMTITVNSAGGLPSTPVPHKELRERCVCVSTIFLENCLENCSPPTSLSPLSPSKHTQV